MTAVDCDFTGECIDCTDIANVIASIDSQLGVLGILRVISIHIQCEAVIFFRLECAAANSIINRQITIVAHRDQRPCIYALIPNIRTIADGLSIQIKRDGLVFDDQRLSKVNIVQKLDGIAIFCSCECVCECLILSITNLCYILACLHAVCTVCIRNGYQALCAEVSGNCAREGTAGNCNFFTCCEIALSVVHPVVCLDRAVALLGSEFAAGDGHSVQTLIAGAIYNRDCRTILDCTIFLSLRNSIAGNSDRAAFIDAQAACADLNAHGLGIDGAVIQSQRTAAGEVDAEAVRNIERAVLQRNGIVCVIAVGLDTAMTVCCYFNAIKYKS